MSKSQPKPEETPPQRDPYLELMLHLAARIDPECFGPVVDEYERTAPPQDPRVEELAKRITITNPEAEISDEAASLLADHFLDIATTLYPDYRNPEERRGARRTQETRKTKKRSARERPAARARKRTGDA